MKPQPRYCLVPVSALCTWYSSRSFSWNERKGWLGLCLSPAAPRFCFDRESVPDWRQWPGRGKMRAACGSLVWSESQRETRFLCSCMSHRHLGSTAETQYCIYKKIPLPLGAPGFPSKLFAMPAPSSGCCVLKPRHASLPSVTVDW